MEIMPRCPNCEKHTLGPDKEWDFGRFHVKMYNCTKCGNQFREFFRGSTMQFVLSAHNGGLGKRKVSKETLDRQRTNQ
jgi:ribosomal protein L37AE/L43A